METGPDPALPGWNWADDDLTAMAQQAADVLADILRDGPTGSAVRRPPPDQVATWAGAAWPDEGRSPADLLDEVTTTIAPYPFGNAHPRYSAWVNSPPHPLGAAAAGLAAAMNPSVAGGNHAAVHLEHLTVRWFTELLGWPNTAGGYFVSGGSAATLSALAAARHRATADIGHDDRRDGIAALGRRAVVYASAEAHSCVTKAVEALGLGSANITSIGVDAEHRLLPDDLDRQLTADRVSGVLPVAVVASVGAVNSGVVDPIAEIATICAAHQVWLHVDAAYGGPAILLLDEWSDTCRALSRADSIALDPHKWLYVPVDAGLVLFADTSTARDTFSLVPPYLRTAGDADEPVWFSEFGLEQTRPFRALKVWATLSHLGKAGVRRLIARDIAVARALCTAIDGAPDFDLLASGLSVVCFRHHPPEMPGDELDAHNRRLLAAVLERGRTFVAGTQVDSAAAFRVCVVNPGTTTAHLLALLDEIRACI
jgi:aromatic-L-amino-acid decarboxylase